MRGEGAKEEEERRGLLCAEEDALDRLLAASLQSQRRSAEVAQLLQEDSLSLQKTLGRCESTQAVLSGAGVSLLALEDSRRRRRARLLATVALLFVLDAALVYFKFMR